MRAVFRIACEIGAGFVEATVHTLPFTPSVGMRIAPLPDADALVVNDVFWFAGDPAQLEVWLGDDIDTDRPWSYWKKQGFTKGKPPTPKAPTP
jgi:hypothetical protein